MREDFMGFREQKKTGGRCRHPFLRYQIDPNATMDRLTIPRGGLWKLRSGVLRKSFFTVFIYSKWKV
jgi:hypothetical protein